MREDRKDNINCLIRWTIDVSRSVSSNNNNTTKNKTKQQQRSSSTRNGGHLEDDSISWWESSLSCGVLCVDTIVDIIGERTKNRGGASWGGGSGKVPESVSYCH